jgi:hypothetical protein
MAIHTEGDMSVTVMDYGQFYSLERCLFEIVGDKFRKQRFLGATDKSNAVMANLLG